MLCFEEENPKHFDPENLRHFDLENQKHFDQESLDSGPVVVLRPMGNVKEKVYREAKYDYDGNDKEDDVVCDVPAGS